jgi:gliding motility-associated-like protein
MNQRKVTFSLIIFLVSIFFNGFAGAIKHPEPSSMVRFTENKTQWDKNILFRAQLDGGAMFLEKNCFTYNFYDKETLRKNHVSKSKERPATVTSHAFRMSFHGASDFAKASPRKRTPDYCNYFIGNDKSKWAADVRNYKEVFYDNMYPGIDVEVLGMQNSIKYNFYVAAHADASAIRLQYDGLSKITLERKSLRLVTTLNELIEEKPYAYQVINGKRVEVLCEFELENNVVSFRFPKGYDEELELVIDPILVFACSSGSTADNFGMTATYDDIGNLYAGGTVFNQGYPTTLGAFDTAYSGIVAFGRTDVVITKYDSSGTFLQYSTYLGGSTSTEVVSSLIVNPSNELMLFGATGSSDFPVTAGAYDVSFNGGTNLFFGSNGTEYADGTDLYITKFNISGTALLASTFVGGTENEGANSSTTLVYNYGDYYRGEIQTDAAGNCYIASCTFSTDFPVTAGCFQNSNGGGMDGVLFKMPPNLSTMMWSSYIGGVADDGCYALTIDPFLNVYATGGTSSLDFPTTVGSFGPFYNGGITDGFITKVQSDGSTILRSTLIGTGVYDQSFLIQLDNNLDVYVVGQSEGSMPVTPGVYSNANSKQFIWQLDNNLSTILFSTNFGNGSGVVNISPSAFLVDTCGNIYVCGWGGNILTGTPTTGMPLTSDALQPSTDGFNFYLFVLTPDATSLLYATYFGGALSQEHIDGGTSRFDKKGIVYHGVCAGCGGNDDFPVTPGSWPNTGADVNHNTDNNNCNMGVFKFDFQAAGVSADALVTPNDTLCAGDSVHFNNTSTNAYNFLWNFGDGSPEVSQQSPVHYYSTAGDFNVMLIAFDSTGCIFSDTSYLIVHIIPRPVVSLGADTILCEDPLLTLDAGTSANIYTWSTGETTQTITADTIGTFWVTVSNNICEVSDSINIDLFSAFQLGPDSTLCNGQSIVLDATSPGASYLWSTGQVFPQINVSSPGSYWVQLDYGVCQISDTIQIDYLSYPLVPLPDTVKICPGNTLILDAGSPGSSYLWSTGQSSQTIDVSGGGVYSVAVSNGSCISYDSTLVIQIPAVTWESRISLCNIQSYTLHAGFNGVSYLWSTGATTESIEITDEGQYWVLMSRDGCILSDTVTVYGAVGSGVLWCPNSFTPNANGLNDTFLPRGRDITYYNFQIFDRWGELIFETKDQDSGWDGTYKGKLCKFDVYVWKVEYKTECGGDELITKIGHVSLVR